MRLQGIRAGRLPAGVAGEQGPLSTLRLPLQRPQEGAHGGGDGRDEAAGRGLLPRPQEGDLRRPADRRRQLEQPRLQPLVRERGPLPPPARHGPPPEAPAERERLRVQTGRRLGDHAHVRDEAELPRAPLEELRRAGVAREGAHRHRDLRGGRAVPLLHREVPVRQPRHLRRHRPYQGRRPDHRPEAKHRRPPRARGIHRAFR
mmetsp:Transcript_30393/g.85724  ORF Transcript_30393/g.85724 Transcript_30393/m.85724 type:complete len:203 (-) Transcript_30393:641-1249(-)